MLVIAPEEISQTRTGRIPMRLVEMETCRFMALRTLPVVKALAPLLAAAEHQLAHITVQLGNKSVSHEALLDSLSLWRALWSGPPPKTSTVLSPPALMTRWSRSASTS